MRGFLSWVLFTLSCPYIVTVVAASEKITLWQFGAPNRLYRGLTTLPLVPVRTAPDGAATSYDYVFVNNVVTGGSTVVSTETRDLVASAAGWYDIIPGGDLIISCALVGSGETYGACYNVFPSSTVLANSGVASAIVLEVSGVPSQTTTTVPSSTANAFSASNSLGSSVQTPLPTATFTPSSSSSNSSSQPTHVSSGAVAGIVAGVVVTAIIAVALWVCCWRRRRWRSGAVNSSQDAEVALRPMAKEPTTAPFLRPRPFALPSNKHTLPPGRHYPMLPVAPVSTWESDDRTTADSSASSAFSPEKTASDSEIGDEMSTAQLLSALYRRVENDPRVSEGLGALARRHVRAEVDRRELAEVPPPVYTESEGPAP